jgi:hypothetical protein
MDSGRLTGRTPMTNTATAAGERWARTAPALDLSRLRRFVEAEHAGEHGDREESLAELLFEALRPAAAGDKAALDAFWARAMGAEDPAVHDELVLEWLDGALPGWEG